MAYEILGDDIGTLEASVDMSAVERIAVVVNSTGKLAIAGAGVKPLGILGNSPKVGEAGLVYTSNVVISVAGATVTAGDELEVGTDGKVIKKNTGIGFAVALTSGTADKEISIKLY